MPITSFIYSEVIHFILLSYRLMLHSQCAFIPTNHQISHHTHLYPPSATTPYPITSTPPALFLFTFLEHSITILSTLLILLFPCNYFRDIYYVSNMFFLYHSLFYSFPFFRYLFLLVTCFPFYFIFSIYVHYHWILILTLLFLFSCFFSFRCYGLQVLLLPRKAKVISLSLIKACSYGPRIASLLKKGFVFWG